MLTTRQANIQAAGLRRTQERVADRNRVTLHLEWDANLRESTILQTVKRAVEADGVLVSTVDADGEAAFLRHRIARREQQIEQLQEEINRLNAKLDQRGDTAHETHEEMTLAQWAKAMGWSYPTAWRRVQAECVGYRTVRNSSSHAGYIVFPETYVPPVKKSTKKKTTKKARRK